MATDTQVRYTPEDLLEITDRPMPELIDGELVEREVGQKSDSIAASALAIIWMFVNEARLGLVNGAQGSYQIFPGEPTKVRIPDVSFTRWDRLPSREPAAGHGRVVPDLIVEVVSPNDTYSSVQAKVAEFLAVGVRLVWILVPETRSVEVHRGDHTGLTLLLGDILDGEDVLPGFRCEIASLFV